MRRIERVRSHRIEPLWDRVDRNRIELAVFVVSLLVASALAAALLLGVFLEVVGLVLVLIGMLGIMLGGPLAIVVFAAAYVLTLAVLYNLGAILVIWCGVAVLATAIYIAVALSRCERWLLARLEASLVPTGELLPTKHALKDMAIAAGLNVAPALWVLETSNVNAFVFAKGARRPVVGVTRGLTERLTPDEQRAVFANLMARLRAGDIIWATSVAAIMSPIWTIRSYGLTAREDPTGTRGGATSGDAKRARRLQSARWLLFMVLMYPVGAFVIATELIAFGHRSSLLRHAEVADAEGMLLLKEPRSMLAALEKCVRFNNYVPTAGPSFSHLFYCWTGDSSTDDAHDSEYRRITRLREVLGVEGLAEPQVTPNTPVLAPPVALRPEG